MRYLVDPLQQLCPVIRIVGIKWNTTLMRPSRYYGHFNLTGTKAQSVFFSFKEPL